MWFGSGAHGFTRRTGTVLQEKQVAVADDKTHELSKKGEEIDGALFC